MNKIKLFMENFIVYGLGGIISKLVPLIMVPIVTRIMPTTDYFGISDLSNTVVSFASAIAVMGMYDAMYRLFFEKEDEGYKRRVCSTALAFTLCTSVVVFFLLLLFKEQIAKYFFSNKKYAYIVYISAMAALVGATNNIISAPTRMQNQRKIFLVTNTISPIISYGISIPMLNAGYYTIALPLAAVVSGITMEISFGILNRKWFNPRNVDLKLLKQLLSIAIPLMPNFLIYWLFNSCDKIMITNMIGIGAAGIYSAASKLGQCSQLIYTAFAGGWQYFAFSTMKENNQVKSNSLVFEYLGIISFAVTIFICAWSYPIFKVLFSSQYLSGYIVAPYLFFAPLLQMLFQVACNQFIVVKKTWPNMFILSGGAVTNVIVNYYLIPVLGIEGAALATLLGYCLSVLICVMVLYKMKLMQLEKRFFVATIVMIIYLIIWRIFINRNIIVATMLAFAVTGVFIYLYRDTLIKIFRMVRKSRSQM